MAAVFKICILLTVVLFFNQNVCSKKTNFLRYLRMRMEKRNSKNGSKKNAAPVPATQQKSKGSDSQLETNKLVLAALYGGLGMGIESAGSFDYANSLNAKIQAAGGYGIPSGIYSYAFDPTTGMPFMCDPSKTPPGGQNQVTSAAAVKPAANPPAQPPPAATIAQAPAPAPVPPPALVPPPAPPPALVPVPAPAPPPALAPALVPAPGKPFVADKPSVQLTDSHVSTPAAVAPAKTPPAQTATAGNQAGKSLFQSAENQEVTHQNTTVMTPEQPTPGKSTQELKEQRFSPINDVTTAMSPVSSTQNNGKGVESDDKPNPTPSVDAMIFPGKEMKSSNLDKDIMLTMSPSNPTGSDVSNDVNKDMPTPTASGNQQMGTTNTNYGNQLTSSKSPGNPKNTATQSNLSANQLTPLFTNTQQTSQAIVSKQTRARSLSKLINGQKFKTSRRNIVNIKLPEIPPCPDMRQFHWPWNCLENGKGNSVKKECIENYAREMLPYDGYSNELQPFY